MAVWGRYPHKLNPAHPKTAAIAKMLEQNRAFLWRKILYLEQHGSRLWLTIRMNLARTRVRRDGGSKVKMPDLSTFPVVLVAICK